MYTVRPATGNDLTAIYTLYQAVAAVPVGIARAPVEVTETYIRHFMELSAARGIELVIDNPDDSAQIIAEIHCHQPVPRIFQLLMSELTIAVHPQFHGKGIGKQIFTHLLQHISTQ